jgi:DNA-binding response OmpR family regulator
MTQPRVPEARKRVLIVDDEESVLFAAKLRVKKMGFDPFTAENGYEALKIAESNPPDMALIDVMMPGMNGFTLCAELRKRSATAKIPIIIVTALHSDSDKELAFANGATEFMVKPYDGSLLERKLRQYLGSPFR